MEISMLRFFPIIVATQLWPLVWVTAVFRFLIQASRVRIFQLQTFLQIPLSSGKSQRPCPPGMLGRTGWSLFLSEAPVAWPAVLWVCSHGWWERWLTQLCGQMVGGQWMVKSVSRGHEQELDSDQGWASGGSDVERQLACSQWTWDISKFRA